MIAFLFSMIITIPTGFDVGEFVPAIFLVMTPLFSLLFVFLVGVIILRLIRVARRQKL